jgi:mono/diheme cytochrome c family protein
MKSLFKLLILMVVMVSLASCQDKSKPNFQYFPDMYEPIGYEAYGEADFLPYGMEAKLPAEGSVSRGHKPFDIDGTLEGYDLAKATLMNPLDSTQIDTPRAGQLYNIYCGVCHGQKGDGQGILVQREKILGVPAFNDAGRAVTEGSVYHSIYYGKNVMGSYANQLDEEERWQVVDYVMQLKAELGGSQTVKD